MKTHKVEGGVMSWYESSKEKIAKLHQSLPETASYQERAKCLKDNYHYAYRRGHAYKAWLKARKEYLYGYAKTIEGVPEKYLSPLERLMKKGRG